MSQKQTKTCLVISYGPVPTSQYQTIEGGGMRAWGLAQGLRANDVIVTVAINASFPQEIKDYEGIRLTNWSPDQQFVDLINTYDAVVVSYCMGDDSVFIAKNISDDVQLILDAYVPIYVEVSARESNDVDNEYRHYMADIERFNYVLRRGDYFLCANEAQKTFYTGVLASLGIVNPRSYREDRIVVVPFGIDSDPIKSKLNPYSKLGIKNSDKVVLWFGGLYPWFRIEEYLDAIKVLSTKHDDMKFVIVGGKNPFNPNPDFFRQYEKALSFAKEKNLLNKHLYFVDWVDFRDRINWYAHSDFVISINQPGEENKFSWRTRVMDYVWGEVVTLTNGGDPLSEELINKGAAIRLPELTSQSISENIESIYTNKSILVDAQAKLKAIKPSYYWEEITLLITNILKNAHHLYTDEKAYRKKLHLPTDQTKTVQDIYQVGKIYKIKRIAKLPPRVISYARRKGLRRSVKLASDIARNQVKNRLQPREKRFIFISHPIDNTGAPLVLMQLIKEVAASYSPKRIRIIAPHIMPNNLRLLREEGIKVDKAALNLGARLTGLQLGIQKNDFILMNTVAIYDNYRNYILNALEKGKLKHAFWFIHEDKDQLKVVSPQLLDKKEVTKISKLAGKGLLTILVPSKRIRDEYSALFNTKNVQSVDLHVDVDEKYKVSRPVKDYSSLNFLITGTPSDGRKGQLIALAAFHEFLTTYYSRDPSRYRNFSLNLVSIGDDYISQQIKTIGASVLGERLQIYPSMPKEEVLEVYRKCNAVICCSLNETFALYVAEGMLMGHIVLRNNSAGIDEQLKEGENGYFVDSNDVIQFAQIIEKILNKKTSSDEQLKAMGDVSRSIAKKFEDSSYLKALGL